MEGMQELRPAKAWPSPQQLHQKIAITTSLFLFLLFFATFLFPPEPPMTESPSATLPSRRSPPMKNFATNFSSPHGSLPSVQGVNLTTLVKTMNWSLAAAVTLVVGGGTLLYCCLLETVKLTPKNPDIGEASFKSWPSLEYFEYHDLFSMEEIDVCTKPHSDLVSMYVCYEHVKLRKLEWESFLAKAFEGKDLDHPKLKAYKEFDKYFKYGRDLRVVFIAQNRLTNFDRIDSSQIMAFFIVEKKFDGSFLHLPIVLLSEAMHCGFEAILEGFAIRVNIIHGDSTFSTEWTRHIEWAHAPPRWNYLNYEMRRFKEAFWDQFTPTFELKDGNTSLHISEKDFQAIKEKFSGYYNYEMENSLPEEGKPLDFSKIARIFQTSSQEKLKSMVKSLISRELIFELNSHFDFTKNLDSNTLKVCILYAVRQYLKSNLVGLNVVQFLSDRYLLRTPKSLYFELHRYGKPNTVTPKLHEYLGLRFKAIESVNRSDDLLKFTVKDLPADIRSFYCIINLIAFASVRYKKFELLMHAVRLIQEKFKDLSLESSKISHFYEFESQKASFQGSALTAHLLKTLGSMPALKHLGMRDLDDPILSLSIKLLYEEWSSKSPKEFLRFMMDCSPLGKNTPL